MAEAIAALIIVKETADTVTSVVKAIQSLKGLYDSFQGRESKSKELDEFINEVKKIVAAEIEASDLQRNLGEVSAACDSWYRSSGKIKAISTLPVKTPEQQRTRNDELREVAADLRRELSDLVEVIDYFKSGRRKPQTPDMLSVYSVTFTMRNAMSFTDTAIFSATSGAINEDQVESAISEVEDTVNFVSSKCQEYRQFRASQLNVVRENEPGSPHIVYFRVVSDSGGDWLIPNLRGKIFDPREYPIIPTIWDKTEFGRELVPKFLKQLDSLVTEAKLKLRG